MIRTSYKYKIFNPKSTKNGMMFTIQEFDKITKAKRYWTVFTNEAHNLTECQFVIIKEIESMDSLKEYNNKPQFSMSAKITTVESDGGDAKNDFDTGKVNVVTDDMLPF